MICPDCHGTGFIPWLGVGTTTPHRWVLHPCPECNGSGIASCCDAAGSATGDEPVMLHRPWPTYAPVNP
jgi:DnaJ-class molecular chaperone